MLALREDPLFGGAIRLNLLTGQKVILKDLGWKRLAGPITDEDLSQIYYYLEKFYGLKSEKNILHAINIVSAENSFHPIIDHLNTLAAGFVHKENDHAGAFLLLHGRYSVLAHYLKVSLKNSRLLKIPKLHPQSAAFSFYFAGFKGTSRPAGYAVSFSLSSLWIRSAVSTRYRSSPRLLHSRAYR